MSGATQTGGQRERATSLPAKRRSAETPTRAPAIASSDQEFVRRQVDALGLDRILVRLVHRDSLIDRKRRAENRRVEAASLTLAAARAWNKDGYEVSVAADEPCGLVVVTRIDKDGLTRLDKAGLRPSCVIKVGPRFDAFVRLCPADHPLGREARMLSTAARMVTGLAQGDPRPAHWQRGGALAGTIVYRRGDRPARVTVAEAHVATEGLTLLAEATALIRVLDEAAEAAADAGVDPIGEIDGMAFFTGPAAEAQAAAVYHRQAAVARRYGVTSPEAVDRTVVMAALRCGASPDRVRAIVRAGSPVAARHANVKFYLATLLREALLDPDLRRHVEAQVRRFGELARLLGTAGNAAQLASSLERLDAGN